MRFYIMDQGVNFYGDVIAEITNKEEYNIYTPYRYFLVEFDTGNDKIYPRVMNIMISTYPKKYRYISCETEIRTK